MKKATSFRLSEQALRELERLAEKWGISQASVLELLIREAASRPKPVMPSAQATR